MYLTVYSDDLPLARSFEITLSLVSEFGKSIAQNVPSPRTLLRMLGNLDCN